jgi:hypothetical protein
MKQEVEVLIKLTLEVDADKSKKDIRNYVSGKGFLGKYDSSFPYNVVAYDILSVKEEAEIYGNE